MADSTKGRRKKSPLKEKVRGMRAAGVSREALAEVLGRRYKSPAAQKAALRKLMRDYGGAHAPRLGQKKGG